MIPNHLRNELGLTFEDDGEFYMSFRDFLKYFGELEICHLSPDSVDVGDNRKKFEVFQFNGDWRAGLSSGGCGNAGNGTYIVCIRAGTHNIAIKYVLYLCYKIST